MGAFFARPTHAILDRSDLTSAWLRDEALAIDKVVTSAELQTVKEFAGFPLTVRTPG